MSRQKNTRRDRGRAKTPRQHSKSNSNKSFQQMAHQQCKRGKTELPEHGLHRVYNGSTAEDVLSFGAICKETSGFAVICFNTATSRRESFSHGHGEKQVWGGNGGEKGALRLSLGGASSIPKYGVPTIDDDDDSSRIEPRPAEQRHRGQERAAHPSATV